MQCSCGGDAKNVFVNAYTASQHEKCLTDAYPHKPEKYPCVVHRNACEGCGRQSVHITYNVGGIHPKAGEVVQGWESIPAPKKQSTRRLF